MRANIVGETCLETFLHTGYDDFGTLHKNSYDCMGYCGDGCVAVGNAKDCAKHDVCSYYKGMVQGFAAYGFATDVDCGDEAAQTLINCREKKRFHKS